MSYVINYLNNIASCGIIFIIIKNDNVIILSIFESKNASRIYRDAKFT